MRLPPTLRLTRRRRQVLCLRAAGWSYRRIASVLNIPVKTVKNELGACARGLLPGVTDGKADAQTYRLVYCLGLLDGGVAPEDVPAHLHALILRAHALSQGELTQPRDNDPSSC